MHEDLKGSGILSTKSGAGVAWTPKSIVNFNDKMMQEIEGGDFDT